ncbi:hypothetical protein F5878DRAFT_129496 [Lentinula raphanica]|uniref:Uncharacterized protein n=1 Tax=Lentinula raphanica TaxID=153919 RepID=A0AA38UFI5_9AGAR|nr:hypothetical protein F5878DRAFT_129496 [Lentinula raphanica]
MAMVNVNSGKRGKDTGRNTGKDSAREAIETSLLSFSREIYRTLDAKQAEILRLSENLKKAEDDSKELVATKITLETTSDRLRSAIEALAKVEEQLKSTNESLKQAHEARKSADDARNAAEDSRKDALLQRDWFKSELDMFRMESAAKLSQLQSQSEEAKAEVINVKNDLKSTKAETQAEIEGFRREMDGARNERDQAVKMLHLAQLKNEDWERECDQRAEQINYWKDQAKNWHDQAKRDRLKLKSESAAAAFTPLTPASGSGSTRRRYDDEDEDQLADEDEPSHGATTPDSPTHVQRRREPVGIVRGNASAQRQRGGTNTTANMQELRTPKANPKTPKTNKGLTSASTNAAPSTLLDSSKVAPRRKTFLSSSSRGEQSMPEPHRARQIRPGDDQVLQSRRPDIEGKEGNDQGYESAKSLSSLVYPVNPDPQDPLRTPHHHRSRHDSDDEDYSCKGSSSHQNATTTTPSVMHSRVVRRVSEHRFELDVKLEDEEDQLDLNTRNANGHHADVAVENNNGNVSHDELDEENDGDREPMRRLSRTQGWEKGSEKSRVQAIENQSQSAWDLFVNDQVVDEAEIQAGPSNPRGRAQGTVKKTRRRNSQGRKLAGSSRSRSRPKRRSNNNSEDDDATSENLFGSNHRDGGDDDDDDDKVEYRRPILTRPSRPRPSYPSSSPASSEDELMITSQGINEINGSSRTIGAADVSRTPHDGSRSSHHVSSSRKRPPTPHTSSTSDGGARSTTAKKRRKR